MSIHLTGPCGMVLRTAVCEQPINLSGPSGHLSYEARLSVPHVTVTAIPSLCQKLARHVRAPTIASPLTCQWNEAKNPSTASGSPPLRGEALYAKKRLSHMRQPLLSIKFVVFSLQSLAKNFNLFLQTRYYKLQTIFSLRFRKRRQRLLYGRLRG